MGTQSALSHGATALADELDDPGDEDRPTPLHLPPPPRVPTFGRYQPRMEPALSGFLLDPSEVANVLSSATVAAAPPVAPEAPVAQPAESLDSVAPSGQPAPPSKRSAEPDPAWARPAWRRSQRLAIAAVGCTVVVVIALLAMHLVQAAP